MIHENANLHAYAVCPQTHHTSHLTLNLTLTELHDEFTFHVNCINYIT